MALGDVLQSFSTPGSSPRGLTWDGTNLWHSDSSAETIYKLDPSDGSIIDSFSAPGGNPNGLAWDGSRLWNCDTSDHTIYELDPSDGSVLGSFSSPADFPVGLAWDGTNLWVASNSTNLIYKVDSSDGSVLDSFSAPGAGANIGLTWDGTSLWASDPGTGDTIYRLDPSNGAVLDSFSSPGGGPRGLAYDGSDLWNADSTEGAIYRLEWESFNDAPTADAGPDQVVDERATVNLDGTGSTDPEDGQAGLSYAWTVLDDDGTGLTTGDLTDADTDSPSFTAPEISGVDAGIIIQLEVTDSGGLTDTDTVTITVSDTTLVEKTGAGGVVLGGHAGVEFQRFVQADVTGAGGVVLGGAAGVEFAHTGGQVPSDIVVEWDFDNDGDFDEPVEDITDFVMALETVAGRDWPSLLTGRASPGELKATLDNGDGRFSFFNTDSPLNTGDNSLRTGRKLRVRSAEATTSPDPAVLARDRFRRSNGSLGDTETGQTWSNELVDDLVISNQEAIATSEGDEHLAVVDVGAADYYVQAQVVRAGPETTGRDGGVAGIVYRFQDTSNYSLAVLHADDHQLQLVDVVSGTPSTVETVDVEAYDRMTIGVLVEGGTVTLHQEGVAVATAAAIQADETQVGLYALWGDGNLAPAVSDFHVWSGLPAEVEGILWTGDVSSLANTDGSVGSHNKATLAGQGWLSRPAGQKVRPPSTVDGRTTGNLVGATLRMANLLHPPCPRIDGGDVTTGPFGMQAVDAIEALRRFEEAEFGFLHEINEGYICFASRTARDGSTSQATFSDDPGPGEFGYHKVALKDWRHEVFNRVFAGVTPQAPSGVSVNTGSQNSFGTSTPLEVDLPATVDEGDLLLVLVSVNGGGDPADFTEPLGWTPLGHQNGVGPTGSAAVLASARTADGTEGGTSVVFGTTEASGSSGGAAWQVYRVTDWFGSVGDGVDSGDFSESDDPKAAFPPWGPAPSLFIAVRTGTGTITIADTAYPVGYTDGFSTDVGSAIETVNATIQSAHRIASVKVENPGSFGGTFSPSVSKGAVVLAVRGPNVDTNGEPTTDQVEVQRDDVDSQDDHNAIRTYRNSANLFASDADAEDYADLVLAQHADDRPIVELSFWATTSAPRRAQAIRRRVSDRITLVADGDSGLGISGDFFIESIGHNFEEAGKRWEVTWELSPAPG